MEPIILDLRPVQWPTFKRCFIAVVIIFIITSIILMILSIIPVGLYFILTMILLLGQAAVNWYGSKPIKVLFDEKGITGSVSLRKAISLTWDEIAKIDVQMFAMDIQTKDGRTQHIDLGEISYKQQKTVKPQIIDLAKSKGIHVKLP